jgi:hypothetical protein
MKDKVVLTDCDGCLTDWSYAFDQWMKRHGYNIVPEHVNEYAMDLRYGIEKQESKRLIRMFNESAWIRKLPPLRDSIHYVQKLHREHGYIFHCITSLSDDPYSQHLRTKNLIEMFGPTVFEKYVYLDTGADKDHVLEQYRGTGCWWIEDKYTNALAGLDVGLRPLLMTHDHNEGFVDENITNVSNWREIYEIITNSQG